MGKRNVVLLNLCTCLVPSKIFLLLQFWEAICSFRPPSLPVCALGSSSGQWHKEAWSQLGPSALNNMVGIIYRVIWSALCSFSSIPSSGWSLNIRERNSVPEGSYKAHVTSQHRYHSGWALLCQRALNMDAFNNGLWHKHKNLVPNEIKAEPEIKYQCPGEKIFLSECRMAQKTYQTLWKANIHWAAGRWS